MRNAIRRFPAAVPRDLHDFVMYLLHQGEKSERERERPKAKTGMLLGRESNLLFTEGKKKKDGVSIDRRLRSQTREMHYD